MKNITYLLCGNHPKSKTMKERIVKIILSLKKSKNRLDIDEMEKELNLDRVADSSKFYRPFSILKEWELVESERTVEYDDKGKRTIKTTYILTEDMFLNHIKRNFHDLCERELEMLK